MPMIDTSALIQAGIPLNKKMLKYGNAIDQNGKIITPDLKKFNLDYTSVFNIVRHQNMIETYERYMWINVPFGLTPDLIERVLFFRGRGVFYFNDKVDKFQFLPFALNGIVDEYGRFTACNSLPFAGSDSAIKNGKKENKDTQSAVYEDLPLVYDLPYDEETLNYIRKGKTYGIILNDSSLMLSQQPIIRYNFVQPILHLMATLMQIINTAMFGMADHNLVQVENESELDELNNQINAINKDILDGKRFTGVIGNFPITPIKTSSSYDVEGLFGTFNSLSNLLKSITGISNPGIFDKKAHLLQEEQNLNGSNADDIYYNGLRMRQEFCLMVQAYYGYPIWCSSKRNMTEQEVADMAMGETNDPDNTVQKSGYGDKENGT